MFRYLDTNAYNICLKFLHLGIQIGTAYWASEIDGYYCKSAFIMNVTYIVYGLIGLNLLLAIFFGYRANKFVDYLSLIINLVLSGGIFYFTIEGYNKYNTCAPSRALYEFFFVQTIVSVILIILIMIAKGTWAERYAHWPGNLAWPILFLKFSFPGTLQIPAIVIGSIFTFICLSSLILNIYYYKSHDLSKDRLLTNQWSLSIILMFTTQVLAAIMLLIVNEKSNEYQWQYGHKMYVIFVGVNFIDIFFCLYGYKKLLTAAQQDQ